jgi:hypothetical protein
MPYISPIYQDTNNLKEYTSPLTIQVCSEETKNGNIPVVLYWHGGGHIGFYASRDATIDSIVTSLKENPKYKMTPVDICQVFTYSKKSNQYESPKKVIDYSQRIEEITSELDVKLMIWLRAE